MLWSDSDGNMETLTTDADGNWMTTVPPGLTQAEVDETTLPDGVTQTEGDNPSVVFANLGEDTDAGNDGYSTATIFGHVYLDENNNGTQDPGEMDLEGVDVVILDSEGMMQTVTTDADF